MALIKEMMVEMFGEFDYGRYDLYSVVSFDGECLYMSSKHEGLFERSYGKSAYENMHPDDCELVKKQLDLIRDLGTAGKISARFKRPHCYVEVLIDVIPVQENGFLFLSKLNKECCRCLQLAI